jgi:hypothetical protein
MRLKDREENTIQQQKEVYIIVRIAGTHYAHLENANCIM